MKRCPRCWWHDQWEYIEGELWMCLKCAWFPGIEQSEIYEDWLSDN